MDPENGIIMLVALFLSIYASKPLGRKIISNLRMPRFFGPKIFGKQHHVVRGVLDNWEL